MRVNPGLLMPFLSLLLLAAPASAEEHGHIQGRIVDATTKQVLIGVNVAVVGTKRGASTNAEGVFRIENLPENVYKIRISYVGYVTHTETDVLVVRDKTSYVSEIELRAAPLESDAVSVTPEIAAAPVSSHSFQREELRRAPGTSGDILRTLGTLPGVSSSEGEFSAMSVRGGGVHDNLILIDNIPFAKINHFEGGSREQETQGGRFSVFTAGLIERATFYGGGFGAEYGGKGSSVLDLKISEGNTESPTVSGSYDLLGLELNYDGPTYLFENTSMILNVRDFDAKLALELGDQEDFGDPTLADVIAKTTTHLNAQNKISLLGIFSTDRLRRGPHNIIKADDLVENDIWDIDESRWLLGANWRLLTSKTSVLHNTFYFRTNDRFRSIGYAWADEFGGQLPPSESELQLREDVGLQKEEEVELGWKSDFDYSINDWGTLSMGIDIQNVKLDYNFRQNGLDTLYQFTRNDRLPDPGRKFLVLDPEDVNYHFDGGATHAAAYASFDATIDKFVVIPGLRYSYNGFSKASRIAPRLQLRYQAAANTMLNLASGIYYQKPINKFIAASGTNNLLSDEQSIHYILGVHHQPADDLKLTVETYYKSFDKLISPTGSAGNVYSNRGDAWSSGIDAILLKRFTDSYYGQLSYSYAIAKRNDHDGFGEYTSPNNQTHNFSVFFGYQINREWFVSAKWKYNVGRPKDRFVVHENVLNNSEVMRFSKEITERNADRLPDFHLLSVRVDYRKQFGPLGLITFLELDNLYNRFNTWEDRFSELTGEEKGLGLGFFANVGFKLEI